MKYPQYTLGFIIGFCLGGLAFMVPILIKGVRTSAEPQPKSSRFEVVDNYNGCNVLKWSGNGQYAEYKFFLECPTNHKVIKNDRG